jgi:hypothetical protein
MKSLISVVVFLSTVFGGNVYADAKGPGADIFYRLIETYRQACVHGCTDPFKNEDAFNVEQPGQSRLANDVESTLKYVATIQAQIWADTILEGDYYAEGNTRLDNVMALYKDNEFIGYRITYSERAWFTGECDFDGEEETTLKDCQEGRIHESTFVSPDFKTYFRDEDALADFSG